MARLSAPHRAATLARACLLVVLAVLLLEGVALANGRFPASSAVIFDPHDAKTMYVRVTFGLLATRDGGASWRWICESAIGFSGIEDPTYVVTPKGTLVAATYSGVAVSRDRGCTFGFAGGAGPTAAEREKRHRRMGGGHHGPGKPRVLSDLTMRPDGEIVGVMSVFSKVKGTGTSYDNRLVVSKDDAETFEDLGGEIDASLLIESVEIADTDPDRIYITALRGEGDARRAVFLTSSNKGLSWSEIDLGLVKGETGAFIARVDPKNRDRVYVRTNGLVDAPSRLLVTDDGGRSWTKIHDAKTPLLGFALSNDGSRVFVGSGDGVASASIGKDIAPGIAFRKGMAADIRCLGVDGAGVLWACSSERTGFFVGSSKQGSGAEPGDAFDARLHLLDLKGPLECPEDSSVAEQCSQDEWAKQRLFLGFKDIPDAGGATTSQKPASGAADTKGTGPASEGPGSWKTAAVGAVIGLAIVVGVRALRRRRS